RTLSANQCHTDPRPCFRHALAHAVLIRSISRGHSWLCLRVGTRRAIYLDDRPPRHAHLSVFSGKTSLSGLERRVPTTCSREAPSRGAGVTRGNGARRNGAAALGLRSVRYEQPLRDVPSDVAHLFGLQHVSERGHVTAALGRSCDDIHHAVLRGVGEVGATVATKPAITMTSRTERLEQRLAVRKVGFARGNRYCRAVADDADGCSRRR